MEKSSSKNSYELISMTESDDSFSPHPAQEIAFLKAPSRRKRLKKRSERCRSDEDLSPQGCCAVYTRFISVSFIVIFLCCWLAVLTWMVIIFNSELRKFDNTIVKVTGAGGVPESLRKLHRISSDLQTNQTSLYHRLTNLTDKLDLLTSQVAAVSSDLKIAEEFNNNWKAVEGLQNQMSTFGERLRDLNVTVSGLINIGTLLDEDYRSLNSSVSDIQYKISNWESSLVAETEPGGSVTMMNPLMGFVKNLTQSIASVNETLSSRVDKIVESYKHDWEVFENLTASETEKRTEDLKKDFIKQIDELKSSIGVHQTGSEPAVKFSNK